MIPVFVPSYKRPKATFLRRSLKYKFPLVVFVRQEEKSDYSYLLQRPNTQLITLPEYVSNIGETRKEMINYAIRNRIPKIFMLDDDIARLDLSYWDNDKSRVRASGTIKGKPEDMDLVLATWEQHWNKTEATLFGASYRPFSWNIDRSEIEENRRAQLQQCIGVNVKKLYMNKLNYQSNSVVGNEDLFLQLQCYEKGLECLKTNAIQYDCAAMGTGDGGCNASEPGSIQDKQDRRVEAFLSACNHPELIRVAQTRSGVKSVKFNWREISKIMGD